MPMSEFSPSPREYLDQHLEPKTEKSKEASRPFFQDGYIGIYEGDGRIEHNDEKSSFSLDYEQVDEGFKNRILEFTRKEGVDSKKAEQTKAFLASPTFLLRNLNITSGKDPEENLVLGDILPPNHKTYIFFNPTETNLPSSIGEDVEAQASIIWLGENPTNLEGLLALFHEIGHLHESRKEEALDVIKKIGDRQILTQTEAAILLHSERDAWSFALAKLRPFLNKEAREFALATIHQTALQSYSDTIRSETFPHWLENTINFLRNILGKEPL